MTTKYDTYTTEELIFLLVQCDQVIEDLHKEIARLHEKIEYFSVPPSNA